MMKNQYDRKCLCKMSLVKFYGTSMWQEKLADKYSGNSASEKKHSLNVNVSVVYTDGRVEGKNIRQGGREKIEKLTESECMCICAARDDLLIHCQWNVCSP